MTTILVVEDCGPLLDGICEVLELENYQVLRAANGLQGLEVLRAQVELPDLILADIVMPGMDGLEFFKAVCAEWEHVPFLFMTAKGELPKVAGIAPDDYIVKPFAVEDLLTAIEARLAP